MSMPVPPQPAKLVVGLIINSKSLLDDVARHLSPLLGDIDILSPWISFDFTDYYNAEMGTALYRRLLAFQRLVAQEALPGIKHATNAIEEHFARDGRRQVNIDPGILLYERFVLATGKNYAHRIYIGQNIYADLTLIYRKGGYQVLPWTYPDYASDAIRDFLLQVRNRYAQDLALMH